MIHNVRPHRVFQNLSKDNNHVHLTIPTISGVESQTINSLDTLLLIAVARIYEVESILEIGTSFGYTALHLSMNTSAAIATIDIEKKPAVFGGMGIERITAAIVDVEPRPTEMVFCDCNYTSELCRQGTELAFACHPKVIAWHDFGNPLCPGQAQNIIELSQTRDIYHVEDTWMCFWFADGRKL